MNLRINMLFFGVFFMELVILYFLDLCIFLLISLQLLKTGVKNLQRYDLPTVMHGKLFSFTCNCDNVCYCKNKLIETNEHRLNIYCVNLSYKDIPWNLSKVDFYGTEVFVRFRELSALERFELKSYQI